MIVSTRTQVNYKNFGNVSHNPCLLLASLLLLLVLFIYLWMSRSGISSHQYWGSQVDWFIYLNNQFSSYPMFWHNLTQLGDAFILLPLLSFFILVRPIVWAGFFGAIPLATLLTHGGKAFASVPRPAAVLDHGSFTIIDDALMGSDSLPSGHTATVFVAGTVIMLVLFFSQRKRSRWLVLSTLLLVTSMLAISRVAVGAHWPLDVVLGAVCGYLGGVSGILLAQRYTRWWSWITQPHSQIVLGLVLLSWSIALLSTITDPKSQMSIVVWLAVLVGLCTSSILISRFYIRNHIANQSTAAASSLTD